MYDCGNVDWNDTVIVGGVVWSRRCATAAGQPRRQRSRHQPRTLRYVTSSSDEMKL